MSSAASLSPDQQKLMEAVRSVLQSVNPGTTQVNDAALMEIVATSAFRPPSANAIGPSSAAAASQTGLEQGGGSLDTLTGKGRRRESERIEVGGDSEQRDLSRSASRNERDVSGGEFAAAAAEDVRGDGGKRRKKGDKATDEEIEVGSSGEAGLGDGEVEKVFFFHAEEEKRTCEKMLLVRTREKERSIW